MEQRIGNKKSKTESRGKNVLEVFEHIVELAEDTNLNNDYFDNASAYIRYASRKLALSPMQTVLLALFVDRSEDNCIRISEIASYVGCRTTKILRLSSKIDTLESKHYLRASRSRNNLSYHVPGEVLQSLKHNQPYVHTVEPIADLQAFFDRFNDLIPYQGRKCVEFAESIPGIAATKLPGFYKNPNFAPRNLKIV